MADITFDNLQQKVAAFEQQRQQAFDNANALTGAIQLAQQLMRELQPPKKVRKPRTTPQV